MTTQRSAASSPTMLGDILKDAGRDFESSKRTIPTNVKYSVVAEKLLSEFGEGDNASLRRELFDKCQRECEKHHEVAYRIVVGAVRSAKTARDPGRYFSATVARRMREAGLFEDQTSGGW